MDGVITKALALTEELAEVLTKASLEIESERYIAGCILDINKELNAELQKRRDSHINDC